MSQIVIDSSVAIKWFVVEPYSAEAHQILDQYQEGALTLLAPDLINAEVGNIVWKKHRFQGLAAGDAQKVIDEFRKLKLDSYGRLVGCGLSVSRSATMHGLRCHVRSSECTGKLSLRYSGREVG